VPVWELQDIHTSCQNILLIFIRNLFLSVLYIALSSEIVFFWFCCFVLYVILTLFFGFVVWCAFVSSNKYYIHTYIIRWGGKLYHFSVASFSIFITPKIIKVHVSSVVDITSCRLSSWSLGERSIWWACPSVCFCLYLCDARGHISGIGMEQGFTSHSTQNRSFRICSSQPISWLGTGKNKNPRKQHKTVVQFSPNFWALLPMSVVRFCSGAVAIRDVLPVLWMTSHLHVVCHRGEGQCHVCARCVDFACQPASKISRTFSARTMCSLWKRYRLSYISGLSYLFGFSFHKQTQKYLAVAYLFFFRTDSTDSPDCLPILLSISVFTL